MNSSFNWTNTTAELPEYCVYLRVLRITHTTTGITVTAILTSVLNGITAAMAIVGNSLMLYVFYSCKRLQTPSNLLLASLCVTDLLTGMIVQPLSIARRLIEASGQHHCIIRAVCAYHAFLCIGMSIQSIAVVSIDRCLAIKLPFKYASIASLPRYTRVVSLCWLAWIVVTSLPFAKAFDASQFFIVIATLICINISIVLISYGQIFIVVLKHRKRIHQQTPKQRHFGKGIESSKENNTNTIAIVILVMLVCYLPLLPLLLFRGTVGDRVHIVYIFDAWVDVFVYACSSVNPLIYWYRSKEIKSALHIILRKWHLTKRKMPSQLSRRTVEAMPFTISYRKRAEPNGTDKQNYNKITKEAIENASTQKPKTMNFLR